MILTELFTAVTHVTSQLIGKWLPPPHTSCIGLTIPGQPYIDQFQNSGFVGVDSQGWLDLLEDDLSSLRPVLIWLEPLLRARRINLRFIAESIARHFIDTQNAGGFNISILDFGYPQLLKHISRPPLFLSGIGECSHLSLQSLAVVGSRKASYEALRASVDLGMSLAQAHYCVVSGGAIGCDIAVHEGMLAGEKHDISAAIVFAGGLHARFPRCNERAFKEILNRGGVFLSERLWFQDVLPHDFPSRNRIVSGMCQATAVMSAAPRSGTLITAHEALEQGRDVFVFQTVTGDARFEGSQELIDDGAMPFSSSGELVCFLNQEYRGVSGEFRADSGRYCQSVT